MSNYDDIKAECYEANLLLPEYKLIDLTFGNVSVAVPERRVFAIKPSGVDYSSMKIDDMVVLDFDGKLVEAKAAAKAPLHFAQDLANDPVATLSSVPEGIFGCLNRAKEAVTNAVDGNNDNNSDDNVVEDVSGFAKMKRDIAIKLGVDPYTTNETFQNELSKVAWPAFLGKFAVNLGMAAIGGPALSVTNLSINLSNSIRDKSPAQLRRMNTDLL